MAGTKDMKFPKLLSSSHAFTDLVIKETHENLLHSGVSQTLSQIRYKYWILQGRRQVQKVVRRCRKCIRPIGKSYSMPNIPQWPTERIISSAPFSFTGLDYFGAIYVKKNDEISKCWVCLYTCLAIRAIHLEVVNDLSAEELSPAHFLLIYPKTGIAVIEQDLDPDYLTKISTKETLISKWTMLQSYVNRLWKIWSNEYLLSLRERYQLSYAKGTKGLATPKEADIVLIKEDLPRGSWRLGKIIELIRSRDDEIRAAKVQLASKKFFSRAINQLYPLECSSPDPSKIDLAKQKEVSSVSCY